MWAREGTIFKYTYSWLEPSLSTSIPPEWRGHCRWALYRITNTPYYSYKATKRSITVKCELTLALETWRSKEGERRARRNNSKRWKVRAQKYWLWNFSNSEGSVRVIRIAHVGTFMFACRWRWPLSLDRGQTFWSQALQVRDLCTKWKKNNQYQRILPWSLSLPLSVPLYPSLPTLPFPPPPRHGQVPHWQWGGSQDWSEAHWHRTSGQGE